MWIWHAVLTTVYCRSTFYFWKRSNGRVVLRCLVYRDAASLAAVFVRSSLLAHSRTCALACVHALVSGGCSRGPARACACLRVRTCVCVPACVCLRVRACACVLACVCLRVRVRTAAASACTCARAQVGLLDQKEDELRSSEEKSLNAIVQQVRTETMRSLTVSSKRPK
eukprot:776956-Pleurochrysis_carterae.AAC.2